MALSRAAGLCRLALRTQWAAVRLLTSVAAGGEPPADASKPGRVIDREALRRERALRPPDDPALPASSRKAFSAPRPSYEQVKLNKAISCSSTVDEVLDLASARPALLNCVIVSTALHRVAKLVGKSEPALWLKEDARFKQLMRNARSLVERGAMDAQGFSNMLYACGQVGIAPPSSWLNAYWENSALVLGEFVEQALSNTLYACGQLGITPPNHWLHRYWGASAAKLGGFIPQDLCNTMYACGQLGITPPSKWLQSFWRASALKMGEFNAQDFSNTLYVCGQLCITPPDYWLQRYWHASALKLGEFTEQGLSNTMYACGQLRITPPDYWLQRYWHASGPKLVEFDEQGLSITLLACAQLDAKPPANWLHLFCDSFESSLPDASVQGLTNTALSMATLGLWELQLWPSLWERLCHALPRDVDNWNPETQLQAQQLYQSYQAATLERPGLLSAPDPGTLVAARKSWIDGMGNTSSSLHAEVSDCLTQMGIAHANERWCKRAERSIDIVIEGAGAPVAVEVDGPHHFLHDGRQDGSTLLRNRMLAAHGWRVVVVDFRVWQHELQTGEQREYLRRLLA